MGEKEEDQGPSSLMREKLFLGIPDKAMASSANPKFLEDYNDEDSNTSFRYIEIPDRKVTVSRIMFTK